MKVGDKVHYTPSYPDPVIENGIIKSIPDTEHCFVVYHCGGEWDNYQDYTAAITSNNALQEGWIGEQENG